MLDAAASPAAPRPPLALTLSCSADGLGSHSLGEGKNPPAGVLFAWTVATSSLERHGWRGFLVNTQLSAKVKTVSSGFLVAFAEVFTVALMLRR